MSLDPTDYDLRELQRATRESTRQAEESSNGSRESADGAASNGSRTTADSSRESGRGRDSGRGGSILGRRESSPEARTSSTGFEFGGSLDSRPSFDSTLFGLGSTASAPDERPYLKSLPEGYEAEITILEWLEELVIAGGFRGTLNVLEYYRSIGWLAESVEEELGEYARIAADSWPERDGSSIDMQDHRRSLTYVARLASMSDQQS